MDHLSLGQKSYSLIKEKILGDEIRPGDRIREDLLAEEISMSRTPVREAINQLAAEGFVRQVPRKGVFAVDFTLEEVLDIAETRMIVEAQAARLCCRNITESQLEEMEQILAQYQKALFGQGRIQANVYDGKFHKKIGEACGSKLLAKYVDELEDLVVVARKMSSYRADIYDPQKSVDQHAAILSALHEGDEEKAAKAVLVNTQELKRHFVE